jgi:hypothetical protein
MAGDLPDLGGGWLAMLLTGLGVGGTAIYKSFRKVKDDLGDDRQTEKANKAMDGVIVRMEAEITRQNGVIIELSSRVDKMAEERNDAREKLATAQAQALVLQGKVEALEATVADLKAELTEAEKKMDMRDNGKRRRATDYHHEWVDDRERKDLE